MPYIWTPKESTVRYGQGFPKEKAMAPIDFKLVFFRVPKSRGRGKGRGELRLLS
jgi:hypothetical protein